MSKWLISVPVWGESYVETFLTCAWPALEIAIAELDQPTRILIHTDQPTYIGRMMVAGNVEFRRVPASSYIGLQMSHADAIASAEVGERIALLNADLIVS